MQREDLEQIEIDDIEVIDIKGDITLLFICPNNEKRAFLQNLLFYFKRELIKRKDDNGEVKTIGLYFNDFRYIRQLNPEKKIENIKGYQWILDDKVEFVNTAILNEYGQLQTSPHQKISLHPL